MIICRKMNSKLVKHSPHFAKTSTLQQNRSIRFPTNLINRTLALYSWTVIRCLFILISTYIQEYSRRIPNLMLAELPDATSLGHGSFNSKQRATKHVYNAKCSAFFAINLTCWNIGILITSNRLSQTSERLWHNKTNC